jgi:hypothetical protein
MNMEHDFGEGRFGSAGGRGIDRFPGLAEPHPDWSVLRARFAALHALRRALAAVPAERSPAGRFTDSAEAVLRSCRETERGVNPICSANSKAAGTIFTAVAASPTPGDRGLQ